MDNAGVKLLKERSIQLQGLRIISEPLFHYVRHLINALVFHIKDTAVSQQG